MAARPRRSLFSSSPPRICTIAGSDSGGGAGIQADLKTIQSLGGFGLSVLTALTAQNTVGVQAIHDVPPEFVEKQLQSVTSDIAIDAFKVGMLSNEGIVRALARQLRELQGAASVVLDPVMVSTSGSLLLNHASIDALTKELLPLCTILTPNLPEAHQLLDHARSAGIIQQTQNGAIPDAALNGSAATATGEETSLTTLRALMQAARQLCELGPRSVLVKGGHQVLSKASLDSALAEMQYQTSAEEDQAAARELAGAASLTALGIGTDGAVVSSGRTGSERLTIVRTDDQPGSDILRHWPGSKQRDWDAVIVDVLYETHAQDDARFTLFIKPHIASTATHGTGCTLSSAIATHLGAGHSLQQSVSLGITYVQSSIARGMPDLGSGPGPLNHACTIERRGVLAPSPNDRFPLTSALISRCHSIWHPFVRHPFIQGIADGTLPRESFVYFLRQDYLFLRHYSRVWASGASSAAAARTFDDIKLFAGMAAAMAGEAEVHLKLCQEGWGISREDLELHTEESAATLAYTRYVLDVSRSGDALELLIATGPCLVGYGEAGLWLGQQRRKRVEGGVKQAGVDESHRSALDTWIKCYEGDEFQQAVRSGIESIEARAVSDPPSPSRMRSLQRIWNAAVRLEIAMWDEAMDTSLRRVVVDP